MKNGKNFILTLFISIFTTTGIFSQSCNCFVNVDSADVANGTYQIAHMTLGTDTGVPPGYHCNDCSSHLISFPFNFCFYGQNYNSLYIDNKGCVTFTNPDFTFSSRKFPLGNDTVMLAPFYSNVSDTPAYVSTVSFADIYYKVTSTHMIVQWNRVGYATFDDDLFNNFQLIITNGSDTILPPGNNVSYCYELMQWACGDSSGGSAGFAGEAPATIGVNKGDGRHYAQFGSFDFPGYSYFGIADTNDEIYWLNGNSFTFNTCVTGNIIPPVIVNPDSCSNFTVCVGDTLAFNAYFLCPQEGQTANLTSSSPGLSGLSYAISRIDSIYQISSKLVATLSDTGTHTITLTATDNSSPALSNSRIITVRVVDCSTSAGEIAIKGNVNPGSIIVPNPNNGKFTIQCSVNSSQSSVEIYNMFGERISSKYGIHSSPISMDLSNQPAGIYLYRIISETGNLIGEGKFVIQ